MSTASNTGIIQIPQLGSSAQTAVNMGGNADYMKWLEDNNYNVGNMTGADFASTEKLYNDRGIGGPSTDWGMTGMGGVALGVGQLGLGAMSYLENSKTADKQRALMDQQITNNKFALGNAKAYKEAVNKTFGDRVSLNKTSGNKGALDEASDSKGM